ncbi:MAG: LCP family protein [Bifidobacterium sp.]|nr:LCP family protein [Bifidobacterium sp.]
MNGQETTLGGKMDAHPRHSAIAYRIRHRWIKLIACIVIAVIAFGAAVAAATWLNINGVVQDNKVESLLEEDEQLDPNSGKPITFVLIGQDTRDGAGNSEISGGTAEDAGLHNADTTMVVEIGANREFINLVSIPRDSVVDVPVCRTTNGTIPAQYGVMFNSIFSTAYREGGNLSSAASCTVSAVNSLTGMHISNFIVVDFKGLADMIDALGGVDICIPVDTVDANTELDLKKGLHHLDGVQATNYARMRHGTGTDGSDIMRTTRQQYLIKALLDEAISKNLFTQTSQLYQLALAALSSLNISEGMANTNALMGLAVSLRNLKLDHVYTQTVPVVAAPFDPNRVVWADSAEEVWKKFREDKPLFGSDSTSSSDESSASPSDDSSSASPSPSETTPEPSESTETSEATNSHSASPTPTPTVDPKTGLIKEKDGTLIDPETGGVVDPETGSIMDPDTNQYVGIAYQYLNNTVCAVRSDDK